MEQELIIASSPIDTGINSWLLNSGTKLLNYKTCASPKHGLVPVGTRFIASSQIPSSHSSSSAPIYFWPFDKPQLAVKSFPAEPIGPLISNSEGTYLIGGGTSGSIYVWEVASGKLLNKWNAHYRSVTCLSISNDESLLISGSEDGGVRVWNLIMMFDNIRKGEYGSLYLYSFTEHALKVTDLVSGTGLSNSIVISSSEDRTCKVMSLSEGRVLRSITLPSIIDSILMDPREHRFFAGCRDGRIYIIALNVENNPVIANLHDQCKGVTSLACKDGSKLVSGHEDGIVRIWDIESQHVVRILKHAKAPISNVIIVKPSRVVANLSNQKCLSKYMDSIEDNSEGNIIILPRPCWKPDYLSSDMMTRHLKELQANDSSGAAEMELERTKLENKKLIEIAEKWKNLCHDQQSFCVNEFF